MHDHDVTVTPGTDREYAERMRAYIGGTVAGEYIWTSEAGVECRCLALDKVAHTVGAAGCAFVVLHEAVELVGGKVPAHVPGAYPTLGCCGGTIALEPEEPARRPGLALIATDAEWRMIAKALDARAHTFAGLADEDDELARSVGRDYERLAGRIRLALTVASRPAPSWGESLPSLDADNL